MQILLVIIGGALGVLCRYGMMQLGWFDQEKYCYTALINLIGCLIIGIVWAMFRHYDASQGWQSFCITGVLGGFTTYSAFALDSVKLMEGGMMARSISYIGVTLIGGLAACALGLFVTDKLLKL